MRLKVLAAMVALVFVAVGTTYAQDRSDSLGPVYEFSIGLADHDVDDLWSNWSKEGGVDVGGEVIFNRPQMKLFWGTIRPNLGLNINTKGDTSKLYGGFLWEFIPWSPLFFRFGLGVAVHNGETKGGRDDKKGLGSAVLFRTPVEAGVTLYDHHRLLVRFDHVSNASLANPNEGLDTVGFFYGYRF